jgi:hypothetical protein
VWRRLLGNRFLGDSFWGPAMLLSEYGTRIHQYEEINGGDLRRRGDLTFMIFKLRGRSEPRSIMW